VLPPGIALARLWTAKEALIKIGECSLEEMRDCEIGIVQAAWWRWQEQRDWRLTGSSWLA
jgi:phosphopantetheinyl transferase (holo-ACP synthase)